MRTVSGILLSIVFLFGLTSVANAQVSVEGGSGMFYLDKARTLGHKNFGINLTYTNSRYWPGNSPSNASGLLASITAGIGDSLEVSLLAPWSSIEPDSGDTESGVSDGLAKVKWNFLHNEKYGIRTSLIGSLTLPFGDADKGMGAEQAFPGLAIAIDKAYENIVWSVTGGYVAADKAEQNIDPYYTYGLGTEWFPTGGALSLIAEVTGRAWSELVKDRDDNTNLTFGGRYYLNDNITAHAGYSSWTGGNFDSYKYLLGITAGFGVAKQVNGGPVVVPGGDGPDGPDGNGRVGGAVLKIVLESVHFAFDRSSLTAAAKAILDSNLKLIKDNPDLTFIVEGHTDWTGTRAYNQKLGIRRAISAKKYLVKGGVNADRMAVESYGEDKPVASNKTREGRALNRRADFVIKGK